MSTLNLSNIDKQYTQTFFNNVQSLNAQQLNTFKSQFAHGNQAAWHRFIVGAYNHPLTWWIGIIQLQMQMGIWGHHQKSIASTRASLLWQITEPLRNELDKAVRGEDTPFLSGIIRYNLKHHKADISGRLLGGVFTNYASTGGRFGNKRLSQNAKRVRTVTNLALASYGAAIKAIVNGHKSTNQILQSILTGRADQLPNNYTIELDSPVSEE